MRLLRLSRRKFLRVVLILILLIGTSLVVYVKSARGATRTWDGGCGVDTSWSCDANWSSDTEPVSGDSVVFDNTSDNNSTIDASFTGTILTISINSGYDGTITMERSLSVTSSFIQAAGLFDVDDESLTVSGNFNLSAGSFTASSSTTTFNASFTISGSPTFDNNSGTIAFASTTSATISCGGSPFNLVTITKTANSSVTVSSGCTVPLGDDPIVQVGYNSGFTVNGAISGTGTLFLKGYLNGSAWYNPPFTISCGTSSCLSGFDGIDLTTQNNNTITSSFVISGSGTTFDANDYSPFDISTSNFTLSSSATFIAPSGTWNVSSGLTINSGTTFTHSSGTIAIIGSSLTTVTCTGSPFNLVTVTKTGSSASFTISSNCTVPLGNDPIVQVGYSGGVTVNGAISGTGTLFLKGYFNGTAWYNPNLTISCGNSACLTGFDGLDLTTENNSTTTTTFTISGSGTSFDAGDYSPFDLSINNFALSSSAEFIAPSGTMNLVSSLTISSGTTFASNSGTVNFNGTADSTISCTGSPFNLVTITKTGNSAGVDVGSGCTVELGNNPVVQIGVSDDFNVAGALTGDGTLFLKGYNNGSSWYNVDFVLSCGNTNCLIGFEGIDLTTENNSTTTRTFTVTGAGTSFNADLYDPFDININSFTLSSSAEFIAPSGIWDLSANITLNSGTTFDSNGGTLNFIGTGDSIITCTSSPFNLVTLTKTSSSAGVDVSSGCTVEVGNNPVLQIGVSDDVNVIGTLSGDGTLYLKGYNNGSAWYNPGFTVACGSSSCLTGFEGIDFTTENNNTTTTTFTVTGAGTNLDVGDYEVFDINYNHFTLSSSASFTAPSGTWSLKRNFTNSSGTFDANGGTVVLDGSSSQTLSGDITFYNLTATGTSSKTLTFPASGTITVENAISLKGTSSGSRMLLRSSSSGTQWNLIAEGPGDIVYVNLQDSYACDAHSLVANNSADNGNNSCWNFVTNGAQNPTYIFGGVTFGEGVSITGN